MYPDEALLWTIAADYYHCYYSTLIYRFGLVLKRTHTYLELEKCLVNMKINLYSINSLNSKDKRDKYLLV